MDGEWIRQPTGSASVVFVHGILSSHEQCWTNASGISWPELLEREPALAAVGIYGYTYQTNLLSGSYSLDDAVDDLKERLRLDGIRESKYLIFVCHSMGGLVVRKYVVDRSADLIERQVAVGLFLVASPSLGSSYADWLSQIAEFMGQVQVSALRFIRKNEWLKGLDKAFINLRESGRLRIKGKELVEDKLIAPKKTLFGRMVSLMSLLFWRRPIVEDFAGAKYFGDPYKVPESDHRSIAKPEGSDAIQHRLLCAFIEEMIPYEGPQKKLMLIDDEPAVSEAFQLALDRIQGFSLRELPGVSSKEALFRVLSQESGLDGVVVDFDVPPSGIEVYRWLKQWRQEMPIVFYTRHADRPGLIDQLRSSGVVYKDIFLKENTAKDVGLIVQRFQTLWSTPITEAKESHTEAIEEPPAAEDLFPFVDAVARISACLSEFSTSMGSGEAWSDVVNLSGFGEIRDVDDLRKLPVKRTIRVLLLRDQRGLVLRYRDDDPELERAVMSVDQEAQYVDSPAELEILNRRRKQLASRVITHEHLATYKPTTLFELRSGYIIRRVNDEIEVYGRKGNATTFRLPPRFNPYDLL